MSDPPSMSDDTRRAIETHLRTVEELEVLLVVGRDPDRYWSSTAAAEATGLPSGVTAGVLELLAARNLLDVRLGEALLYRFDPAGPDTRAAAQAILEAGWRQRAAVLRIILGMPSPAVRDFAEAFRGEERPRPWLKSSTSSARHESDR